MKKGIVQKAAVIFPILFILVSAALVLNKSNITLSPWTGTEPIGFITYASGNGERTAVIADSEKSVIVLDAAGTLIYKLEAKPHAEKRFTGVKFAELDEENNLYVLDASFGGAFNENHERILKYSPEGKFLGEIYSYRYTNVDFISTKGKISGMAYSGAALYLVRFEDNGFWLERAPSNQGETEALHFFDYPQSLRDLVYVDINVPNRRLSVTTKAGDIKQYGFDGGLSYVQTADPEANVLPWTAVSDRENNLIYADILSGEIVLIDTATGASRVLYTAESPYYRINYTGGTLFCSPYDESTGVARISSEAYLREGFFFDEISSYTYSNFAGYVRIVLFVLLIIDALLLIMTLLALILFLSQQHVGESLRMILFAGICIVFGALMSSLLIINEMNRRYNEKTYNDLENISRLIASSVDTDILSSLSSTVQFDDPDYLRLKDNIKSLFTQLQVKGERLYQIIWMEKEGVVYIMYDLESSTGMLFPFADYEGSYFQEVTESGEYVHVANVTTAEGSWLFTCGPMFNKDGETVAMIETGYDMAAVQEQTRAMIIQTVLIVIATAVAILLIMIEFILIFSAYKKSKSLRLRNENLSARPDSELRQAVMSFFIMVSDAYKKTRTKGEEKPFPFYPEILRMIIFFLFVTGNLATALLPMYAANLYQPLFNLPREFIITLPFTADVIFAALALLIIPNVLEKFGIKRIGLVASAGMVIGNVLCFAATNTLHLAVAYALTGFSAGALILILNTIIGAQKDVEDVTSGFAHFNASYLAGVNVGVVFGSILAQFFPYRIVFLFSSLSALVLICIYIFSIRSKFVNHVYDITYVKERGEKFSLVKFIFTPIVLSSLFLLLLPYVVSMSFTSYFMPVFGTENGLREANVGQLILLSGLFAILFGTSLCEWISRKLPIRIIIFITLLLNAGAIYLFSFDISIPMLIAVVVLLAVANVFALTNIQTYFATLYQARNVSSMQALSVYSEVENISMAVGPVVFSYILASNIAGGMRIFAIALVVCLLIFMLFTIVSGSGKRTAAKGK
jgi:predicted MFS family arabinose efflux permease